MGARSSRVHSVHTLALDGLHEILLSGNEWHGQRAAMDLRIIRGKIVEMKWLPPHGDASGSL